MELHENIEGTYICLLDIAKAFPSTPHMCLVESLQILGALPHVVRMVKSIYTLSSCSYGKLHFPFARGIKERCPLSLALFVLVYETFHTTLAKEFPEPSCFVFVDDIAIVTKNTRDLQRVPKRVQKLFLILGFQTNPGKIEVYKWATTPPQADSGDQHHTTVIRWNGKDILVGPPIFRHFGHTIAHPSRAHKAKDEILAKVEVDLTRYRALPLNAFEGVQLLLFTYSTLVVPYHVYPT